MTPTEHDPHGLHAHQPGAKLDAGKPRPSLAVLGFSRALLAVSDVATFGAAKYTDNGWVNVPNGHARYTDAMLRHLLREGNGESTDPETGLLHAAHAAWNALARLIKLLTAGQGGLIIQPTGLAARKNETGAETPRHLVAVFFRPSKLQNSGQTAYTVDVLCAGSP